MVSVNQRLIPSQLIGFDTAYPIIKANHALSNSAQSGFFYRFGTTVERLPILLEILTVLPEEVFCHLCCISLCQQFDLKKIKLKITPCLLCFVRWGVII